MTMLSFHWTVIFLVMGKRQNLYIKLFRIRLFPTKCMCMANYNNLHLEVLSELSTSTNGNGPARICEKQYIQYIYDQ